MVKKTEIDDAEILFFTKPLKKMDNEVETKEALLRLCYMSEVTQYKVKITIIKERRAGWPSFSNSKVK